MDYDIETGLTKRSDQLLQDIAYIIDHIRENHEPLTLVKLTKLINEFEVLPSLLDKRLTEYINNLSTVFVSNYETNNVSNDTSRFVANAIYSLSKIRGFKIITNFFDSDIHLVHKLISILQQDIDDNEMFVGLLWLSNLVLIPFKFEPNMVEEILLIGNTVAKNVSNGSKNQQVMSILLSRLLSRPDVIQLGYLQSYFANMNWYGLDMDEKSGHLMILNKLLKLCDMNQYFDSIYEWVQFDLISIKVNKSSSLNTSLMIKILCKLGEHFLTKDQFQNLESILNNLINDLLLYYNESLDTNLRYTMAKSLSRLTTKLSQIPNYQYQILLYLIDLLELDLSDKFQEIAINFDFISIPKYHTILLYLGYTALSRALPIRLVPKLLSITHRTLFANQQRLNINIGGQLRDSSCFIIWAILRLIVKDYKSLESENPQMFQSIFIDLMEVSIFDKDLIIRRCGVAVVQEFIGRYGQYLVLNDSAHNKGKQIIQLVELFTSSSVSTLTESFKILNNLLEIGFDKGLIMQMLMKNLHNDFPYQKNVSETLINVLKFESINEVNIGLQNQVSLSDIIECVSHLEHHLYFKSELALTFDLKVEPIPYNEEYIEDHIMFLKYSCKAGTFNQYQTTVLEIIHSKKDMSESLIELFKSMTFYGYTLPDSALRGLSYFPISLAKSVFYVSLKSEQIEGIFQVIHSNANYEIRHSLIDCFHHNYKPEIHNRWLNEMIVLLNDYTTTEQGDVGSRIRYSMMDFIDDYLDDFNKYDISEPLIRISGESIAKLRNKAFSIFSRLKRFEFIDNTNETEYYHQLFSVYAKLSAGETSEFWNGIIASVGGITGDSTNIIESFREFIRFYESLPIDHQKSIIRQILSLLSKVKVESNKILKQYIQALNFIIKMFEAAIEFPQDLLMPLYVKCYNLQINTNNLGRIKLTLRVLEYLVFSPDAKVSLTSFKRLLTICNTHKSLIIREYCLEIIYDIVLTADDKTTLTELESIKIDKLENFKLEMDDFILKHFHST